MNDTNNNYVQISSCFQEKLRRREHSRQYYDRRLNGPGFVQVIYSLSKDSIELVRLLKILLVMNFCH